MLDTPPRDQLYKHWHDFNACEQSYNMIIMRCSKMPKTEYDHTAIMHPAYDTPHKLCNIGGNYVIGISECCYHRRCLRHYRSLLYISFKNPYMKSHTHEYLYQRKSINVRLKSTFTWNHMFYLALKMSPEHDDRSFFLSWEYMKRCMFVKHFWNCHPEIKVL